MITKLEAAGLGYYVKAESTQHRFGKTKPYIYIYIYVIVVTRALGLCLICMPDFPRAAGLRAEGIHIRQSPNAPCYN